MNFALSTRWNTYKHKAGREMIEEILALGFTRVELGYDLTLDLVPDIRNMVANREIIVDSVHNFCPVPLGAPRGHPELFGLASLDNDTQLSAVHHTKKTIEFAAEVGAKTVVVHSGNVDMPNITRKLAILHENGKAFSPKYEKLQFKMYTKRDKKADRHLEVLYRSIEELMPALESSGVRIALENLPTWESMPTEEEAKNIFTHFNSPHLGYWHDIGHGQVRENLGFLSHIASLGTLKPWLFGFHIHDVIPPAQDHVMPGIGEIDFARFKTFAEDGILLVFEPCPGTAKEDISEGLEYLKQSWATD